MDPTQVHAIGKAKAPPPDFSSTLNTVEHLVAQTAKHYRVIWLSEPRQSQEPRIQTRVTGSGLVPSSQELLLLYKCIGTSITYKGSH